MRPDIDICKSKCKRYYELVKNGRLFLVCMNVPEVGQGYVIDKNFKIPNDCDFLLEQLLYDTAVNNFCPQCGETLSDDFKCREHGDVFPTQSGHA